MEACVVVHQGKNVTQVFLCEIAHTQRFEDLSCFLPSLLSALFVQVGDQVAVKKLDFQKLC